MIGENIYLGIKRLMNDLSIFIMTKPIEIYFLIGIIILLTIMALYYSFIGTFNFNNSYDYLVDI